ncbi:MAG: VanZ family protein [Thermodesulfobacteriota bacterium]|nr:VanZ family protein [Thermodesulfobacteriota bacterium]
MNYKFASLGLACTLFIVYLSSIPDKSILGGGSLGEQVISNLAHIPAYAVLTFLWLKAFSLRGFRGGSKVITPIILVCLLAFAVSDEFHQSYVPGRTASAMDIGLDVLGVALGFLVFRFNRRPDVSQVKEHDVNTATRQDKQDHTG